MTQGGTPPPRSKLHREGAGAKALCIAELLFEESDRWRPI